MWPFKRHPYRRPNHARYQALLTELGMCAIREQFAKMMHQSGLIGYDQYLHDVFAAREDEIRALRELRWTGEAGRLQTDLDMRKRWADTPLTKLTDPGTFRGWSQPDD